MKLWSVIIALFIMMAPYTVQAFTIEELNEGDRRAKSIEDYIKDYVDIPKGGIDWKTFGTTKEVQIDKITDDGYNLSYTKPEFSQTVQALNGESIKVKGYMFPLDNAEDQSLFLFGPFPLSCPYHYHVGPSLVIEVHADKNPVQFNYDPVIITGELELVPEDPDYSVFYRLRNARQVK